MMFAFTGPAQVDGSHYERRYLIALAREKGHQIQKRVDEKTNYLVCNGIHIVQQKTRKCQVGEALGAVRITPKRFLQMMGYLP